MKVRALSGNVLVDEFLKGERTVRGIILKNDDGTSGGIRARWAHVHSVASDITDIVPGDWVLVKHGRWSREMTAIDEETREPLTLYVVEYPESTMVVTKERPEDGLVTV